MEIEVKVVKAEGVDLPEYETPGAAGLDVAAHLQEAKVVQPGERVLIETGLHLQIPRGYEIQVRSRSGLALKHGIAVLNSPGTIDSDYRGEIKVLLINHGQEAYSINPGSRIAQLVLAQVATVRWQRVQVLEPTKRGGQGYGSTGV